MEFDRHELGRDGGGASFYASTSFGQRYPSDARLYRYGIGALGSSSECDQVRQLSYHAHSCAFPRHSVGPAGPLLQDPLMAPSFREDRELEIRRFRLREIADRIELAHSRMLEEHDWRAFAIAERAPYACHIPFYPELPPDNSLINHTEKAIQHSRSSQSVAPMYHVGERHGVQKDLNLEPHNGPQVGVDVPSILQREEVGPHMSLSHILEPRNGARPLHQPIEPVVAACPGEPARNVWIDDPIWQDQFTGCSVLLPSHIMHEPPPPPPPPPPLVVLPEPVPLPIIGKEVGSSANTKQKHKKEYGREVVEVQPAMQWSKWSCVLCSENFDSKEAMGAHLQEQHQGCKGDGQSKSEKVESNRSEEAKTGATAASDGDQKKKVVSSTDANKKCEKEAIGAHLQEQHQDIEGNGPSKSEKVEDNKSEEARNGLTMASDGDQKKICELSAQHSNKRIQLDLPLANSKQKSNELHKEEVTNKKIQLELPPFSLKWKSYKAYEEQTPENKEIASSSSTKKMKLDLPVSTVQAPENKEIAGSNTRRKRNLHLPPSNVKQIPNEPSKEEVLPTSESKVKPGTDTTEPGCIGPEKVEKPVQGVSQAVSLPQLEGPKEEASKSVPMPQLDKKVAEKPVQGKSQAVSLPKLEEPKEETSKPMLMPPLDKKLISRNKMNPSLSDRAAISTGHKDTVKPKPNFNEKSSSPVTGITTPVLVMKNGKWFCNLCDAKWMSEKFKEDHIKGKRHKKKLQAQVVAPKTAKPTSEVLGPHTNKMIQLALPLENSRQNSDELHKEKVKDEKIQLESPPFSLKRKSVKGYDEQTPENKESAGCSTTKKIKLDLPVSTVQTPNNEVIAGSNIRRKRNLHLSPLKPDEPSNEEVMPTSESKVQPETDTTGPGCIGPEKGWFCDLCSVNELSQRALDDHFQSNSHLDKLYALLNESKKSEPANKIAAEKPVQGVSQAVSLPRLQGPKADLKRKSVKGYDEQTPENKESAGSSTTKKIKLDLPVSTVQTPNNKVIAGSNIRRKRNLHLPLLNLKQKLDEPSKEEVMPTSERKVQPETDTTGPGCIGPEKGWFCDLCSVNELTQRALDNHFQSNAHLDKLYALLNESKKSEPANKIAAEKPVHLVSQAVPLPKLQGPKAEASKSVPMPQLDEKVAKKPIQGVSQAVSLPKLEELKEETSKSMPSPQLDKELTSQNKMKPSSSNMTVISTGHKDTVKPNSNFSKKKKGAPANGITEPVLVMIDGKWFCNLCNAKRMNGKCKEDHIKGKRHKQNLQAQAAQAVAHRREAVKPTSRLHCCFICNINCTSEDNLVAHFSGMKHREVLKHMFAAGPGGAFNQ